MGRRGFLLAMLLLAAAGYVTWREFVRSDRDERRSETASRIFDVRPDQIARIVLDRPGEGLTISAGAGGWSLGTGQPADASAVSDLIQELIRLKEIRAVDDPGADLARFGLEPPALSVTVETKDARSSSLQIGIPSPAGEEWFARRVGSSSVVLIGSEASSLLAFGHANLGRRAMVDVDPQRLRRISVERAEGKLVFERTGDGWEIAPSGMLADEGKVREIPVLLMRLEPVPGGALPAHEKLENARVTFRMERDGEEPVVVRVGRVDGKTAIEIEGSAFLVASGNIDTLLERPAADWIARRIVVLNRYEATRVTVALDGGRPSVFDKDGEGFREASSLRALSADPVRLLLLHVFEADVAQDPRSGKESGFGTARLSIVATAAGHENRFEFGAPGADGRVAVRCGSRSGRVEGRDYDRARAAAEALLSR